jgi:hypothetical protein
VRAVIGAILEVCVVGMDGRDLRCARRKESFFVEGGVRILPKA